MWTYKNVSRKEFEIKKKHVENIMVSCGAMPISYSPTTTVTSIGNGISDTVVSERAIYEYRNKFFRVDEVLLPEKPFIVIELADNFDQVVNNTMEDTDPFPFDLSDSDMMEDVRFILNKNSNLSG